VDPVPEVEAVADARLTVALNDKNVICALQKGGSVPVSIDEISKMIDLAIEKAAELRKHL
jgi:exosome complex component RRP42